MAKIKDEKIWLSGMTCLSCGDSYYEGYDVYENKTRPCLECGDIKPAYILRSEIRKLIKERDERIEKEEKKICENGKYTVLEIRSLKTSTRVLMKYRAKRSSRNRMRVIEISSNSNKVIVIKLCETKSDLFLKLYWENNLKLVHDDFAYIDFYKRTNKYQIMNS